MDNNRRLNELLGLCWHEKIDFDDECSCGMQWMGPQYARGINKHLRESNPDYAADPRLLLREMMKRDDWPRFLDSIGGFHSAFAGEDGLPSSIKWIDSIPLDYILDTTGKLRDLAIEWLQIKY